MCSHLTHEDGVTIRIGAHCTGRAGRTACAWSVLNNDLLAERPRHVLANNAGSNVGSPAGSERNDQCNRSRRIALRPDSLRHRRERGSGGGQMQKSPAGKFHGVGLPEWRKGLVPFDIGRLNDWPPQLHVGLEERGQLGCRGGRHHRGDFRKSLLDL
jgi:hypothetical protein